MGRSAPAAFAAGFAVAFASWLLLFLAQVGMPTRGSAWIHQLVTTKERLVATTPGPHLVIVGGSGTLYSVRARQLSRELGIPVINGGLHAGIGRAYMIHEARRLVRPGDTLVLCLEYELYTRDDHSAVATDYVVSRDPRYFFSLPPLVQLRDALAMPVSRMLNPYLWKAFRKYPPYPLYIAAEGDVLQNNSVMKTPPMLGNIHRNFAMIDMPSARAGADLHALAHWARETGVRLIAAYPQTVFFPNFLEDTRYGDDFEAIARLYAREDVPVLDSWMDTLMDRSLFFDSVYHTNDLGSAIRTHELAQRLEPYVHGRQWGPPPGPVQRGDNPLEVIDANFHRFEPLEGFGAVQGIDPPSREPFIASMPPRSEAVIRTLVASRGHLVARVKGRQPGQALDVRIDGAPVGKWELDTNEYRRFEADVVLRAGANAVTLAHSAGSASPIDIAEWRVEVPAADAFPPP